MSLTPGLYPAWTLVGGYDRLVLWAVDDDGAGGYAPTGASLSTPLVRPVGWAEEPETRVLDDGALDDVVRVRSVAPELARWADVLELRRWRAAGLRVRAVLVAQGRGPHLVWDEAAPVLLGGFGAGRGALSGDRLVLHSARYAADVEHGPDLLGTDLDRGASWTGEAARVLPAGPAPPLRGLTVWGVGADVTVEARAFDGAVLASATNSGDPDAGDGPPDVELRLPAGTWDVRVAAPARPALLTRPARRRGGAAPPAATAPPAYTPSGLRVLGGGGPSAPTYTPSGLNVAAPEEPA